MDASIHQDVSSFIATMLSLGGFHKVTDDDDKFIMLNDVENDRWKPVTNKGKYLAIYGTKNGDTSIINPFAEGALNNKEDTWFYKEVNSIFSANLIKLIKHVLTRAAAMNDKKNYKKQKGDTQVGDYVGEYGSRISKATVNEFNSLIKDPFEFFNIYVSVRQGKASIHCKVFNDEDRKNHTNVRKTTWLILETIIESLLKIDEEDCKKRDTVFNAYTWTVENGNIPKIEATANVLCKLYKNLSEAADRLLGLDFSGYEVLEKHLPNLSAYYRAAKWCASSINTQPASTVNTSTPSPVGNVSGLPDQVIANMHANNSIGGAIQPNYNAPVYMQRAPEYDNRDSDLPEAIRRNLGYGYR